jgi:hypothetical protein
LTRIEQFYGVENDAKIALIREMDEKQKQHWQKIYADAMKKARRTTPIRRNQLALWLGRLIMVYNSLEDSLGHTLTQELVELIANNEEKQPKQLGIFPPAMERAWNGNLKEIILATMPFKQKLDFLLALLHKRFSNNDNHKEHIFKIADLMRKADEYRNKMIHSVWEESHLGNFSRVKSRSKGQKGLKIERQEVNIKELREAVNSIGAIGFLCGHIIANADFANMYVFDYSRIGKVFNPVQKTQAPRNSIVLPKKLLKG